MAIIKNKYKDKIDKQIKDFPNGDIPSDFTKKIIYDNETISNPTIIRSPKYGDDLNTTEFSKLVADLVYNDTVLNEETKKHNYLYSNGVIKNYKKEFEIYDKNLFQILATYKIKAFTDKDRFSLVVPNSISSNFANGIYSNFYFYTNSQRLLTKYNFFYKEYSILNIITEQGSNVISLADDYSIITFNGEITFTAADATDEEYIGVVLYLPNGVKNTTSYKTKNFLNYLRVGNGALKIGDIFVDIKKDTLVSRSISNDESLNQIKISNITETKFKDSFRTRRDMLIAYYDQTKIKETMVFDGVIDLIVGDERINMYSPINSQLQATPRIKKIEYLTVNNESFHRVYLDDLCLLKGVNNNGNEILFRKINQSFTIKNSINNIFDGEFIIKNIDYVNKTIDFIHPTYNQAFTQPEDSDNIIGYFGYISPNIYIIYSLLIYKNDGYFSETQIMNVDKTFESIGLESDITRIEKTVLEINENGMFEISNDTKHLKNFNGNLLEYDDGQSTDVPSKMATSFMLDQKANGDYILNPVEQQLPNEYDEISMNSLTNSHFIITEDNFSVINNSKVILSEIFLGVKNSLSSIGTEGIKIKIEELTMLYALDDPRKITNIEFNNNDEIKITLFKFDENINVNDILFITNNGMGNGDYQTVKIKRIENNKLVVDKTNSTYTADFKINQKYPIYFNIIKQTTKVCESLLTNDEIRNQIINGLNGKFGDKNSYSKLKFDRFINTINPSDSSLKSGITLSQAKDFKLDVNKYYFVSVAGFVINNIASVYSSILIEDHNNLTDLHSKKSFYNEINIKSFKGRYPNSLIISDEFGDINIFNINRTFAPFFRIPKYSIMAYDFSNLSISIHDIPPREDVVLFDPLTGRFKFHPNATPNKIYISYYTIENLSGAAEAESFTYDRGNDSNDTIKGKIQEFENKFVYGAEFKSPIKINGIITDRNLNYKGPFKLKNNELVLKNNSNFVDLDIERYEIEIDKNSSYEIIDIEKTKLFLRQNIVEKNNDLQSINRQFFDQLFDQTEKNYYEKPTLNNDESVILNISEDTTIDQNLLNTKKWQYILKQENNVTIPFLANKKFNKINFYDFKDNLIIDCTERTKIENLAIGETNLSEILNENIYRKLNEKNYKYALKNDYSEDTTFSFKQNDEIKQLNKTLIKDTEHFNKSELVTVYAETENNELLKSDIYEYTNLNINNTNSDNFIIIDNHIVNFNIKKINKKYANDIIFSGSLAFNDALPSTNLLEGKLYFFTSAGYNSILDKNIQIGDFIVINSESTFDFYKKNDIFNISKLLKADDLSYALNDFNEFNIDYSIASFADSLQINFINNTIVKQHIKKISETKFFISIMLKDSSDIYNLYIQVFELAEDNVFYPMKINQNYTYTKIATSSNNALELNLIKIDKNNIYYDYLALDDEKIVLVYMSLDGFIFKYLYLNDFSINDGIVFINDKKIKSDPKILKLNDEVFSVFFNCENSEIYDTNLGNLEIKNYNILTKNGIIFKYKELLNDYVDVDKIVIDNIKNQSNFEILRINDDSINIFYSNINTFYLNNLSYNEQNDEYVTDSPLGTLNCFKTINFLKTETDYIFDLSNKKTVYYQNIGQTQFPPKIYPFKINSNIFGVNYIEYDLIGNETANRMFTYDINGVLQKEYFENVAYSQQNSEYIKYIYSLNNRQAIEFSSEKIRIFNFNNDYSQMILKEDFDYKVYFEENDYDEFFNNKTKNGVEIINIKDKNDNIFNNKIMSFFTKENNTVSVNLALVDGVNIDFENKIKFDIVPINNAAIADDGDNSLIYQRDIVYVDDNIYLFYAFMVTGGDLLQNAINFYLIEVGKKLVKNTENFTIKNNIESINFLKTTVNNKNSFFFNKTAKNEIEIFCLREKTLSNVLKNAISKFTLKLNSEDDIAFVEFRTLETGFNEIDQTIDMISASSELEISNLFKINLNDEIKYIAESRVTDGGNYKYSYFYIKPNLDTFVFFTLNINNFNINNSFYNAQKNDVIFLGDIDNKIVNYVFNFNTNQYLEEIIENLVSGVKYNFLKLENTEKDCYLLAKINNSVLDIKIFNKKLNENLVFAYQKTDNYAGSIDDIVFNSYMNTYDAFVYFENTASIRLSLKIFPMNAIGSYKNILDFEIVDNKLDSLKSYKNVFSNLSLTGIVEYNLNLNAHCINFLDNTVFLKINNDSIIDSIFYTNVNNNLCIFKITDIIEDGSYKIVFLLGEKEKNDLLDKRVDLNIFINKKYSFYKKSYQSLTLKVNMFNFNGIKRNEYEIYRKNNYYYSNDAVYENNSLYKSNVFVIPGDYKNFEIVYRIDDEYEKTKIYTKKFLIFKNNLYSLNKKNQLLIEEYIDNDVVDFTCEKLSNSNIFINFKKNDDHIYNFILNKDYGLEEIDGDFTKRKLKDFITIKNKNVVNVLDDIQNYEISPFAVKRLFNNYLLLLLKIKKDNITKISHILYKENGTTIDYYNNDYLNLYTLDIADDIIGYSLPTINSFGYTSLYFYKNDSSRDILQFGIDGEGGICKLKGVNIF